MFEGPDALELDMEDGATGEPEPAGAPDATAPGAFEPEGASDDISGGLEPANELDAVAANELDTVGAEAFWWRSLRECVSK